jgi:hypothetical protein
VLITGVSQVARKIMRRRRPRALWACFISKRDERQLFLQTACYKGVEIGRWALNLRPNINRRVEQTNGLRPGDGIAGGWRQFRHSRKADPKRVSSVGCDELSS